MKRKKELSEEEYMFLAEFLSDFSAEAPLFFDLIKKKFGEEDHPCTKFSAIAVNYMQYLKIPLKDQCEIDIGYQEADKIFKNVSNFMTDGYYKGSFE